MMGRLFVIVGPSGAGKDTLLAGAVRARPDLHWARRVITRPSQPGGEPWEGETEAGFARGLHYGVPGAELAPLRMGRDVVMNGSRAAMPAILSVFPQARVILVTASPDILALRLAARSRETPQAVAARLSRAGFDLPPGLAADVVVNDTTPEAGTAALLAHLAAVPQEQDH
jgi:ribose 1,5-bisphosphokinase